MPIINPDTSAQLDMTPLEEGTYPAKITAVEFKHAKSSGNPMIVPEIVIEHDGRSYTRRSYLVITGEGSYGFDQLLRCCGFDSTADEFKDPTLSTKPSFDTDELIGCEINVVIAHEIYNNEIRDKVKSFLPA